MFNEEDLVYFKDNVVLEPLIDNWYAWPHLVFPLTYALNLKKRHLPILNSYLQNPDLHAAAVNDPKMIGGPFMDFPKEKLEDVVAHKERIERDNYDLLELADQIDELNKLLLKYGDGSSLEHLYKKIPSGLKGCVELFYDLNNHPSFRIFEFLIYNSPYFKREAQSFKFYEITEDYRSFVLSTPRINKDDFHLKLPFGSESVDFIYQTSRTPKTFGEIKRKLKIKEDQLYSFQKFFTTSKKVDNPPYTGEDIRIRYFGHACILIECNGISILADPVISYDYDSTIARFTYSDLPESIDYVLITHNHQDHILLETMLKLRNKIKNIVVPRSSSYLQDPSIKMILSHIGFKSIIELEEFAVIEESNIRISALPFLGEHSDLNIRSKACYHVNLKGHSLILAADTRNMSFELYEKVRAIYGGIDVLFLGMECDGAPLSWLYGPLMPSKLSRSYDYSRRLSGSDYEQAMHLVETFRPKHVYVYAMGQEPWLNHIMAIKYTDESNPIIASNKLLKYCEENSIVAERLFGEKEIKL